MTGNDNTTNPVIGPRLVAGLGNPGRRYAGTRHNMGFLVIDRLLDSIQTATGHGLRCLADNNEFVLWEWVRLEDQASRYLLKPLSYMNRSGIAVAYHAGRLNIPAEKILVIHDEVDLPLGRVKLKFGGGLAGHNGLRSITELLGTKDFARLRMGIGRPKDQSPLSHYVLQKFTPGEHDLLQQSLEKAINSIKIIFTHDEQKALQVINT